MELRLSHPTDGVVKLVADLVNVETRGEDWLRYSTSDPREINPVLLQTLAAHGYGVVTLSEVMRSLEDVYLRVVEE
jgi:hypothetical protein